MAEGSGFVLKVFFLRFASEPLKNVKDSDPYTALIRIYIYIWSPPPPRQTPEVYFRSVQEGGGGALFLALP